MEPSAAQLKKFEKFQRLPDAEETLRMALLVAFHAGLELEDLGTRWGITVCPDTTAVVRLNVGNRILMDARPDGMFQLLVVHAPDEPADWADLVEAYNGFPGVENSICLLVEDADTLLDLLDFHDVSVKIERHAAASGRSLPRPEWHNWLLDDWIAALERDDDTESDDAERDYDSEKEDDKEELVVNSAESPAVPGGADANQDRTEHPAQGQDAQSATQLVDPARPLSNDGDQVIFSMSGHGSLRTRPIEIPPDVEYTIVTWTAKDRETGVSVRGVPPSDTFESFSGGQGVFSDTGKVYIDIDSEEAWQLSIQVHRDSSGGPRSGVVASFSGRGDARTRPFTVPKGSEYFVVNWTTTTDKMDVTINGVKPTSAYEIFRGGSKDEGLVYEHGRFFAEVETEGSWTLDIVIE
jgi:hypothetical protein